jgi:hypothetical protein
VCSLWSGTSCSHAGDGGTLFVTTGLHTNGDLTIM